MIFGPAFRIRHNALEHLGDTVSDNFQAGFFQHFATDAGVQCLPCFQYASGKRPVAFQGLTASLCKKDAAILKNERADP
jgi:hypothetical protein